MSADTTTTTTTTTATKEDVVDTPTRSRTQERAWRKDRWADHFGRLALRSGQALLVVIAFTTLAYALIFLRVVVIPVLIALILGAALWPVVSWLDRRGLPRVLSVLVTFLAALGIIGGVFTLVGTAVAGQADELTEGVSGGLEQLQELGENLPFGLTQADVDQLLEQARNALQGAQIGSGVLSGATVAANIATGTVLALFVLFFVLKDGETLYRWLREQLPASTHERVDAVSDHSLHVLGSYVRGTALIAFVDATGIGIALVVLDVPLALPLALITFIASFVPIVGAVSAGLLAALVALVANGPVNALLVVAAIVVVQQIEGNILQPFIQGKALKLHPLAILLAVAAGTIAAGIIGAILAVPLLAVAWGAVTVLRRLRAERDGPVHVHTHRHRGDTGPGHGGPPELATGHAHEVDEPAAPDGPDGPDEPADTRQGSRA
ncbi:AI-2E family transporter [Aquipuribacter nitratireducens]|uniref:AI-2E family transporter n=1 Tax=Aquipuribacter nitratireducens TaxID=650104 RepID=A0ABW0GLY2_9MICO